MINDLPQMLEFSCGIDEHQSAKRFAEPGVVGGLVLLDGVQGCLEISKGTF